LTAPAAQRLGSAVLLQGAPELLELRYLLTLGLRERNRRDGMPASGAARQVLAVISEAITQAMSEGGHSAKGAKGQVNPPRGHADMGNGVRLCRVGVAGFLSGTLERRGR
jgi:hypothetical protein